MSNEQTSIMTNAKVKSKPTNFLDLPTELRQAIFLMSLHDAELHKLGLIEVAEKTQHERVNGMLDCHIDFRKQAAAIRKVDWTLVDDVDFVKEKWIMVYEDLITKWRKVEDWWTY
jgi:hypothetical protein